MYYAPDTPNVKRKSSVNENDLPEEKDNNVELKTYGGSQESLKSTSASSNVLPDNPQEFESLKQMKGLMEEGISK